MADQVGVKSSSVLSIHSHVNNAEGGLLNPNYALFPQPVVDFGDGSDGDVVIPAGVTVLTRDMSYMNLTVQNGGQLYCAGYTIKVKTKLTLNAGGIIWDTENVLVNGQNGAAGVGGAGGIRSISTKRPYTYLPGDGGAGANGPAPAGAATSVGGAGGTATSSTSQEGRVWAGGGGGGGGAIGTAPAAGANGVAAIYGAAGRAGGNAQRLGLNHTKAGGGGGAGGSKIEIWTNEIDNNGAINAPGFPGGTGEGDANAQAGGGGGGGGGAILIYYKIASGGGLGVRSVVGGAGGTSFDGAADGAAGTAGVSFALQIGT